MAHQYEFCFDCNDDIIFIVAAEKEQVTVEILKQAETPIYTTCEHSTGFIVPVVCMWLAENGNTESSPTCTEWFLTQRMLLLKPD